MKNNGKDILVSAAALTIIGGVVTAALAGTNLLTEERIAQQAVATAEGNVAAALADDRYADALVALAALRAPVDEFFDTTMVMDEDPEVRANRLKLLNRFANVFAHVADFSQMAKK